MKWFTCIVLILFGQSGGGLAYSYDKKGVYPTSSQLPSPVPAAPCTWGYERVCATNGVENFLFDNPCELNEFNGRQLRLKQTVLLKTDLANCHPPPAPLDDKAYSYCPQFCNRIFSPVCASYLNVQRNFSNECEMRRHICYTHENWQIVLNGTCVDATCPLDGQEVCAWHDHVQYAFPNLLSLYDDIRLTGRNWHILNVGPCPCPQIYKPICAQVNCTVQTYQNECFLKRDIKNATYWNILFYGECPMMPFNVTNNCNANNTTTTPAPVTSTTIIPTTPTTPAANVTTTLLPPVNITTPNPNDTTTVSPIGGNVTTVAPINNTTLPINCSTPAIIPIPNANRRPVYIVRHNRIIPYRLISHIPTYGKSSYTPYPSVSNGYGNTYGSAGSLSNAYDKGYGVVPNAYDNSQGGTVPSGYTNGKYIAPTPGTYPNAGSGNTAVSGYHGSNYNAPTAHSHKNTAYTKPVSSQYSDYTHSKPNALVAGYSNSKYLAPPSNIPPNAGSGYSSSNYNAPPSYTAPGSGMQPPPNTGYSSPVSSQYSGYTHSKPKPVESGYSYGKYTPSTANAPSNGGDGGYPSPPSGEYSGYSPPKPKPLESGYTPSAPSPPPNGGGADYPSSPSSPYSGYSHPKPKPINSGYPHDQYTPPTPPTPPPNGGSGEYPSPPSKQYSGYSHPKPNPIYAGYSNDKYAPATPSTPPIGGGVGYPSPPSSQYSDHPKPMPIVSVPCNKNKYTPPTYISTTPKPVPPGYGSPPSGQYNEYRHPKPNKHTYGQSEKPYFYGPIQTTTPAYGGAGCNEHASYQGSKPIQPKPKHRPYPSSNAHHTDVYEILKPTHPVYATTTKATTKKPPHTQYYERPSSVYIIKVQPGYHAVPSGGSPQADYNSQKSYGNDNREHKNVYGDAVDDDDDADNDDESLT